MNSFKQKWNLDRQKFMSEVEVRKLKRTIEDKAVADLQKGRTTWPRYWMVIDLAVNADDRGCSCRNCISKARSERTFLNTGISCSRRGYHHFH